eukprot:TRINITY_DN14382_c0_g1_i1.p2 TRINITY_DN14382_c0_g1~~TRINITY_DN14382_c0_g1_i1.p2  ORF type:complete len:324 (+),score=80.65 TRINITY_DN14382_c0_g1_i1:1271-2242(+)
MTVLRAICKALKRPGTRRFSCQPSADEVRRQYFDGLVGRWGSQISIEQTQLHGRGIVATQPIVAGSVLVNEAPFVACLEHAVKDRFCAHCFADLTLASPTKHDPCATAYCSDACKTAAWEEHHEHTCPATSGLASLVAHCEREKRKLPILGANIFGRIIQGIQQHGSLAHTWEPLQVLEFAKGLTPPNWKEDYELLLEHPLLKHSETNRKFFSYDWFSRVMQLLHLNSIAVRFRPEDKPVGVALYILTSFFNHSCDPNALVTFDGTNTARVTAAVPIAAGDEVFISYADTDLPRFDRRLHLEQHYGFLCQCPKCVAEAPKPKR